MYRRVLAAVLAVCLLLLTFGCGNGTADPKQSVDDDSAENGKIAIVLGDQTQCPEVYAAASEIARSHPASVMLLKYAGNFHTDLNAVTNIAKAAAENDNIKVILFADGVKGTGAAVQAVREARDDVCIVVCNPHEGSVEMKGANLILSVDFPALGRAMVEKAKEMGAENFIFYTTNRHLKYSSVVALRRAAEMACEDEGLTFKLSTSVDLYDRGRTLESAKKFLYEDVSRMDETLGKKTALVCTEPQVQGALAAQAILREMVMPATFMPSPLSLSADLSADLTDHYTDSAYAMEQLRAENIGATGRVATWGFSAYTTFLQAAYAYAAGVLNGSGTQTTIDDVQKQIANYAAGAQITVTTDANGAYLVQSELITL